MEEIAVRVKLRCANLDGKYCMIGLGEPLRIYPVLTTASRHPCSDGTHYPSTITNHQHSVATSPSSTISWLRLFVELSSYHVLS